MISPESVREQQNQNLKLHYRAFMALTTAQGVNSFQGRVNSQLVKPKSRKGEWENSEWTPALIPSSIIDWLGKKPLKNIPNTSEQEGTQSSTLQTDKLTLRGAGSCQGTKILRTSVLPGDQKDILMGHQEKQQFHSVPPRLKTGLLLPW